MLAGYCRLCGEMIDRCSSAPPLRTSGSEQSARLLGWVSIDRPFELAHRKHVKALRVAGGSWFCLPSGEVICAAPQIDGESTTVALSRLFESQRFAERQELCLCPPQVVTLETGRLKRLFVLFASQRRIAAAAVDAPDQLDELIDIERQFDANTTLIGGPVVLGDQLLLATRQVGSGGISLHLGQLSAGRSGGPGLRLIDQQTVQTQRKQFLGPLLAWEGEAALLSNDALWLVGALDGRLSVRHFELGETDYFAQSHCYHPGNPCLAGRRLVVMGNDADGTTFYEILFLDGAPILQRVDRAIPETEVAFLPLEIDDQLQLIEIWGRRPHVYSLRGRRRTLDHEPTLDQLGLPQRSGDLLICRRVALDGFELYRLTPADPQLDMRNIGRLVLPEAQAISDALVGEQGCDVLVVDPQDPQNIGVMRIHLEEPAS